MALILEIVNISNLANVSDYKVNVYINNRKIDGPIIVEGHKRSDGWQKLVKTFAKQIKNKEHKPLAKTRDSIFTEQFHAIERK